MAASSSQERGKRKDIFPKGDWNAKKKSIGRDGYQRKQKEYTLNPVKQNKNFAGVVEKFSKDHAAANKGIAFGLIKNIFPEAIEYQGITHGSRGVLTLLALIVFVLSCAAVLKLLEFSNEEFGLVIVLSNYVIIFFILVFNLNFIIKCLRTELFRPEDEPIIFDRKNQMVYRIFRQVKPGWKGLFAPWPLKAAEYDWNLIHAEHHAAVSANTATISRVHALVFSVQASHASPITVDGFQIGSSLPMGEVTVAPMYEHIRNFMEENGPHLPNGETLARKIQSPTLLVCLAKTGPYGRTLKNWWKNAKALTILGFLFFPITLPILTLLGIFSWFSYLTAIPIHWSEHVVNAIGKSVQENQKS